MLRVELNPFDFDCDPELLDKDNLVSYIEILDTHCKGRNATFL